MGECGCGQMNIIKILKINDNKYILIDLYEGCRYCEETIGIALHLVNKEFMNDYNFFDEYFKEITEDFKLDRDHKNISFNFPIISVETLEETITKNKKIISSEIINDDIELELFLEENGLDFIRSLLENVKRKSYICK